MTDEKRNIMKGRPFTLQLDKSKPVTYKPEKQEVRRKMADQEVIQKLENRITHLEGILTSLLIDNHHILVGGRYLAERYIAILKGEEIEE
jgi:hypothetical protein